MKTVCLVLFLAYAGLSVQAQVYLNLQNNFGYTFVDVPTAIDVPEAAGTGAGLVDWDQFHYHGMAQLLFQGAGALSYGAEGGVTRLYYWEERETPIGLSPRFFWGTIWTGHLGGILRWQSSSNLYLLTGASVHIFFDGSGVTVGFPVAVGYEVPVSDAVTLPIEFRADVILGNAVPIGIGGGIGLKFAIGR